MGWFEGISTRTPMTSTSRTPSHYSGRPRGPEGRRIGWIRRSAAPQAGLDQGRVQPDAERCDLADRVLGPAPGGGVAAPLQRRDDLLHQTHLAVRRGLEGTQVARL